MNVLCKWLMPWGLLQIVAGAWAVEPAGNEQVLAQMSTNVVRARLMDKPAPVLSLQWSEVLTLKAAYQVQRNVVRSG